MFRGVLYEGLRQCLEEFCTGLRQCLEEFCMSG